MSSRAKGLRKTTLMGFVVVALLLLTGVILLSGVISGTAPRTSSETTLVTHVSSSGSGVQPQGKAPNFGLSVRPTYSIVGDNATTISMSSGSTYSGNFTVDLPSSQLVRFLLSDLYNGTLTVPDGTTVNVTVGSQNFELQQLNNGTITNDPLFNLTAGETVIGYAITLPTLSIAGSYNLAIAMDTYSGTLTQVENSPVWNVSYGDSYTVNVNIV